MIDRADSEYTSLLQLTNNLLRNRRMILRMSLGFAVLAGLLVLIQDRTYTARTAFIPHSDASTTSLSGLAAQFGIGVSAPAGGHTPDFYDDFLDSRDLRRQLVQGQYIIQDHEGFLWWRTSVERRGTLVDLWEIEETTADQNVEEAMRELSDRFSVSVGRLSGIITVSIRTEWASLSRELAAQTLQFVGDFNRTQRQSRAMEERKFAAERVAAIEQELRAAESNLRQFLEQNRRFAGSPELVFEHDRLNREVTMLQAVRTSLVQAFEQARIDEVRDTPVISVVQSPDVPAVPDRRRLLLKVTGALVIGLLLGCLVALLKTGLSKRDEERQVFDDLRATLRKELRRPWQLLISERSHTR